jgi:hypothetical protein
MGQLGGWIRDEKCHLDKTHHEPEAAVKSQDPSTHWRKKFAPLANERARGGFGTLSTWTLDLSPVDILITPFNPPTSHEHLPSSLTSAKGLPL